MKPSFKQFLAETDELKRTALELMFRKEFEMAEAEADEAARWFLGRLDSFDMKDSTWQKIASRWEDHFQYNARNFDQYVHDRVGEIALGKYKIE